LQGSSAKGSAVGKMVPQPIVSTVTGKQGQLDNMLGDGFVLLGDGIDPSTLLTASEKTAWDALGARYLAVRSGEQAATLDSDVIDLHGTLLTWLRAHKTKAVALRPDRFVAAAHGSGFGVPTTP
jgi:3-(3-hydroxy-phenyl)propionate hydroxylase